MAEVSLIVYSAPDMEKAKRFFGELLGGAPYADTPYYVGYRNGSMEYGLVPSGTNAEPGALPYWTVDDIAATVQSLTDAGGEIVQQVTDVSNALLVASVRVPGGPIVGLRQWPNGSE